MNNLNSIKPVIAIDETKCCNCHRCISVCPVKFCNDGSSGTVVLNHELCIGCGACIEACIHGARTGIDDTTLFFNDLKAGKKIIAIVAPAVAANFFGKTLEINSWLKSIGVKAVFDVSFGAELTTKSYVEEFKKNNPKLMLAQPCPALVTFIETYKPELVKYLARSDSPMAHTVKMIRKYYPQYNDYKIAAISPCFAKRREFDENKTCDYNVTMKSLDTYFVENGINLNSFPKTQYDNPPAERAVLYSTPGGLMRTAERFVPGISAITRKIEGNPEIIEFLSHLEECVKKGEFPEYILVDCLYCGKGCNQGGGTTHNLTLKEKESYVEKRALENRKLWKTKGTAWSLKKLNNTINKYWQPGLYDRNYANRTDVLPMFIKEPSVAELDSIFHQMGKDTELKRKINCQACGYESCHQMAVAIYNKLNAPHNCHFYVQDRAASLKDEFKQELNTSVSQVTNKSVDMLKTTEKDMDSLMNQTANMSTNVSASSSVIEQMISNVKSIANIIQENFDSVQKLETATLQGNERISEVNKLVEIIENESANLMGMSNMVGKIASQTNLLAMNAAIEAAHAGDVGAGFAVVADEIRKLAEDSSKQSKQIGEVLTRIKDMIDSAFEKTGKAQEELNMVADLAGNVKTRENSIKNSMEEQNEAGARVLDGLEHMRSGVDSVIKAAKELKANTDIVVDSISNIQL